MPLTLRPGRHLLYPALAAMLVLGGCARLAQSPINPLNWFGPRQVAAAAPDRAELRPLVPDNRRADPIDSRSLVGQVTELALEPTADGAILRATGITPTQGWFNAQLVETGRDGGVLSFEFRAAAPVGQGAGPEATRTITVATMLTPAELAGVAAIQVLGATNAQTLRR